MDQIKSDINKIINLYYKAHNERIDKEKTPCLWEYYKETKEKLKYCQEHFDEIKFYDYEDIKNWDLETIKNKNIQTINLKKFDYHSYKNKKQLLWINNLYINDLYHVRLDGECFRTRPNYYVYTILFSIGEYYYLFEWIRHDKYDDLNNDKHFNWLDYIKGI